MYFYCNAKTVQYKIMKLKIKSKKSKYTLPVKSLGFSAILNVLK